MNVKTAEEIYRSIDLTGLRPDAPSLREAIEALCKERDEANAEIERFKKEHFDLSAIALERNADASRLCGEVERLTKERDEALTRLKIRTNQRDAAENECDSANRALVEVCKQRDKFKTYHRRAVKLYVRYRIERNEAREETASVRFAAMAEIERIKDKASESSSRLELDDLRTRIAQLEATYGVRDPRGETLAARTKERDEARALATRLGGSLEQATKMIEKITEANREYEKAHENLLHELDTVMKPGGKGYYVGEFLAKHLSQLLEGSPAANYIEMSFATAKGVPQPFTVRVQRHEGKSPAALVAEANAARDAAIKERDEIKALLVDPVALEIGREKENQAKADLYPAFVFQHAPYILNDGAHRRQRLIETAAACLRAIELWAPKAEPVPARPDDVDHVSGCHGCAFIGCGCACPHAHDNGGQVDATKDARPNYPENGGQEGRIG